MCSTRTGSSRDYRCNKASVDLEQVFDPHDQQLLKDWIYRHFEATGSPRARVVLENWESMLPKFVKVYPQEFKRVMKKRAAQAVDAVIAGSRNRPPCRGVERCPWVK